MSHKSGFSTLSASAHDDASGTSGSSVSEEFHNFLADVEDLVKDTTSMTGEDLARAKEKLTARVASAKESLDELGSNMADKARKTAQVTNTYVHEQPWKAIGIGATVGLLLGFALARR
jgi:ElaB/YqjD/DUF883 family membrane-anchored ribosome-binding protein